jgi:FtsP/CotA-like multicopper oxidase with cupredoxin domain
MAGLGASAAAIGPTLLRAREAGAQVVAQAVTSLPGTTLPIPPLLSPPLQDGLRTFDLTLQTGQTAFEPGRPASTLGINGPYLGPTLRASQGDTLAFSILNQIGEPTTVHWHGMLLPAAMDGGPHQEIAPGITWQPSYTIRQEAATLWYHSHELGQARSQVTRGLAGMFILDDDNPAQMMLPNTYGADDIPLILQSYVFGAGQTLVNGALAPVLVTDRQRLRLRLLNASDQQTYTLGLSGNLPFEQVASEGGLLNAPVRLTQLRLGPAERAEIVVDIPSTPLTLQRQGGGGGGRGGGGRGNGGPGGGISNMLTIQPVPGAPAQTSAPGPLPSLLNSIERFDPAQATVTRQMVLAGGRGGRTINGQSMNSMAAMMDMSNAPRVRLGDLERWNVVNTTGQTHLFHVHNVQFQILDRNGVTPPAGELGRKDTVYRHGPRWRDSALAHAVRLLLGRECTLYVSLPHPPARGPGHDGSVRGDTGIGLIRTSTVQADVNVPRAACQSGLTRMRRPRTCNRGRSTDR